MHGFVVAASLKEGSLAEWTGLEPATLDVTGRYSNQLNYHSVGTSETLHFLRLKLAFYRNHQLLQEHLLIFLHPAWDEGAFYRVFPSCKERTQEN